MSDLFYSSVLTLQEQLELLDKDMLKFAKNLGYTKRKLPLVFGDDKYINNNVLLVMPPFSDGRHSEANVRRKNEGKRLKIKKHFEGNEFDLLYEILESYEISNWFITYSHLVPLERHTKNGVKQFACWIAKLIEIIGPKLIIAMGEDAQLSFVKKKYILRDYHGKKITDHNGIPVLLTYPMSYYIDRSSYEDPSYKEFIMNLDWDLLRKEYERRIKCQ